MVETHFGRIEDLRTDNTTNQNTDQLGYTDAAINLRCTEIKDKVKFLFSDFHIPSDREFQGGQEHVFPAFS